MLCEWRCFLATAPCCACWSHRRASTATISKNCKSLPGYCGSRLRGWHPEAGHGIRQGGSGGGGGHTRASTQVYASVVRQRFISAYNRGCRCLLKRVVRPLLTTGPAHSAHQERRRGVTAVFTGCDNHRAGFQNDARYTYVTICRTQTALCRKSFPTTLLYLAAS